MNARVNLMIGALTSVLFLVVGTSVFMEGRTVIGSIIFGLGVLRGTLWIRQFLAVRAEDEE